MTEDIHIFDNGVKVYKSYLIPLQLNRYKKNNIHEPEEEPLFIDMINSMTEQDCFINIGSAIGYYVILARIINKNITICGINPHPKFINQMNKCLELNNINNIILEKSAVTTEPNKNIYLGDHYGSKITSNKIPNQILVKGKTLENIVNDNNLLSKSLYIQMDIQGIEYEIISNLSKKLLLQIKYFIIGTHSLKIHNDCKKWCISNNFFIITDNYYTKNQPDGILVVKKL
tara:strand:+ start:883 stop:1572 length:690 start_codon:yes stop_codon:yes gene_type:complete